MTKRKAKDLQDTIERKLADMFEADSTPDEGAMKLVALGIKYLAVKNKLEESEFGSFFDGDGTGDPEAPARKEPAARRRANGAGADAGDPAS